MMVDAGNVTGIPAVRQVQFANRRARLVGDEWMSCWQDFSKMSLLFPPNVAGQIDYPCVQSIIAKSILEAYTHRKQGE
jgi:hypothetical protein